MNRIWLDIPTILGVFLCDKNVIAKINNIICTKTYDKIFKYICLPKTCYFCGAICIVALKIFDFDFYLRVHSSVHLTDTCCFGNPRYQLLLFTCAELLVWLTCSLR